MNASERRTYIAKLLRDADGPISASAIAAQFHVSRQIIVGDIALLRASGLQVTATPRGYLLDPPDGAPAALCTRTLVCCHDDARLLEELYTIVDLGGAVMDVTVEHSIYGELCAPLHIFSRFDADVFWEKVSCSHARPLCDLTGGVHLHQIRAQNTAALDRIEQALRQKGLLYQKEL